MSELKFKPDAEVAATADFWYDLTDGGYIKPEQFLEPESAQRVNEAIETVREFMRQCENKDLIEDM